MNLNLVGTQSIQTSPLTLWESVIDPAVLQRSIPGCISMDETGPGEYAITLELKVAAVGGNFNGSIKLSEMDPPNGCFINVSGSGTHTPPGDEFRKINIRFDDAGHRKMKNQQSRKFNV